MSAVLCMMKFYMLLIQGVGVIILFIHVVLGCNSKLAVLILHFGVDVTKLRFGLPKSFHLVAMPH